MGNKLNFLPNESHCESDRGQEDTQLGNGHTITAKRLFFFFPLFPALDSGYPNRLTGVIRQAAASG